jgi:hypothetical protein
VKRQLIRGSPPTWGLGKGLITTPHHKKPSCYETLHRDSVAGSCDYGNEYFGFIKGWEFLDYLSDY